MLPTALFCYSQTKSIPVTVVGFFASPVVAILQGMAGMLYYRAHFGDSPTPVTPAHGVVVVNPKDVTTTTTTTTTGSSENHEEEDENGNQTPKCGSFGCMCQHGQRWRRGGPLAPLESQILEQAANNEEPLRLLVIGDSLALGVGTKRSCCPMLPEVVARTISKHLGGKPVFWSSHGFPGANAAWVVRELQQGISTESTTTTTTKHYNNEGKTVATTPGLMEVLSDSSSEDMSTASTAPSETSSLDGGDETTPSFLEWRRQLKEHRRHFSPEITGPYDIVVVMTAANDLKAAMFPFLLQGEDSAFRQEARERGGSYRIELERLLSTLSPLMNTKFGCEKTIQKNQSTRPCQPLVVFPGMPTHALPCFRKYPLQFLSIPVVGLMDNHKRAVSRTYPEQVLYLDAPPLDVIVDYEHQVGKLWDRRAAEDTLLSLRDTTLEECQRTESTMREYYERKRKEYNIVNLEHEPEDPVSQLNPPLPKLSERPGRPGTKIFCLDGVHPNDEGYDFWGRHIGDGIVQAWRRKQQMMKESSSCVMLPPNK